MADSQRIGIVVIGRNEGDRLKRCIDSLSSITNAAVYVDSGSIDDSVAYCMSMDIITVQLDLSKPFTAARARNAGFKKLREHFNDLEYIHFVDGDCYFHDTWIPAALGFLDENVHAAVVCGVRKEINPQESIYNALCDIEWDGPKGIIQECGGDFLVRTEVFEKVGGFNDNLIAGEEPDLCFRIRSLGLKICRVDNTMTYHDANIHQFSQWWKRNMRSGHAYANIAHIHIISKEKIYQREVASITVWGLLIPLLVILGSWAFPYNIGFGCLLFVYLFFKCISNALSEGKMKPKLAVAFSYYIVLGKFAHAAGLVQYFFRRLFKKKYSLIEYK